MARDWKEWTMVCVLILLLILHAALVIDWAVSALATHARPMHS